MEELLYADVGYLENCKELELIVFTLRPGLIQRGIDSHQDASKQEKESNNVQEQNCQNNFIGQPRFNVNLNADEMNNVDSLPRKDKGELCHTATCCRNTKNKTFGKRKCVIDEVECVYAVQDDCLMANLSKIGRDENRTENDIHNDLSDVIRSSENYILDIDMDFFSTQNPFKYSTHL